MQAAAETVPSVAITERERRRGLFFIGIAAAGIGCALALQMGLNQNFLVSEIGVTGFQAGLLETVRESCGIIALGVFALAAGLAEPIIACLALALVAVGMSGYTFAPTYGMVMVMGLIWSMGFHVWAPLPNSMTLALAEPGRAGARLGRVTAVGAIGSGAGMVIAFILTLLGVPIRPLYLVAGAAALVGAGACLGIPRRIKTPGPSFVFRRRYLTYYVLNFLEGWRKQIAVCFAGFLLVNVYKTPLLAMIVLWAAVQGIGFVLSPRVGRLIDKVGEKRILTLYYILVTIFFVAYAFIKSRYVLFAVFVADGATFAFNTGLTTYVSKIAPKSDHTPTLSMGVAMNHVASVTMPFLGGILWSTLGYQWAFLIGLPAAAASIAIVQRLPGKGESAAA
jgi:predicted MFS family arabinose efflux permease